MPTSRLADHQLAPFDADHALAGGRWEIVRSCIDRDFPSGQFSFVDIGGGNGLLADRVLACYPKSHGAVLDSSDLMLSKNNPSDRKRLIKANALDFAKHFQSVDLVFCNWVLHHLVKTASYWQSRENVRRVLAAIDRDCLSQGRLSIIESDYNGYISWVPGVVVFELTSSRAFAPLIRRLGANTAGVGVCFLSHRQWVHTLTISGFRLTSHTAEEAWDWPAYRKVALLLREVNTVTTGLGDRSRRALTYWPGIRRFHEFTMRFAGCIGHKEIGQGIIRIDLLDRDPRTPEPSSVGSYGMTKKTW